MKLPFLEDNWGPRVNKMQRTFDTWSKRKLTVYAAVIGHWVKLLRSILPVSDYWMLKMNDIIWDFY